MLNVISSRLSKGPFAAVLARLHLSPVGHRLARGAFWGVVAAGASRILAIVSSVIAARLLGREGFGELGVIQSTVMMFGTLAGMGLGLTATKYLSEHRVTDPARAGRIMGLCLLSALVSGVVVGIAAFVSAPWLAAKTLAAPQLSGILQIGTLLILFGGIIGAQTGALSGLEAFRSVAQVNIYAGLASFPCLVLGTVWFGVTGAVWGLVVSNAFNVVLNHYALKKEAAASNIRISYEGVFREWRVLGSFSAPALISSMLAGPVGWICNAMLVNQPTGYSEMGIFNAVNQWFYAILFLPNALVANALPIIAERLAADDRHSSRKALFFSLQINAAIVIPVILGGWIASPYIMKAYGSGFEAHWPALLGSLATGGLVAIQIPIGQILIASGRMWLLAFMQLLWACVLCGGAWQMIGYGAMGVVMARLLAYAFHTVTTTAFAWYRLAAPRRSATEVL